MSNTIESCPLCCALITSRRKKEYYRPNYQFKCRIKIIFLIKIYRDSRRIKELINFSFVRYLITTDLDRATLSCSTLTARALHHTDFYYWSLNCPSLHFSNNFKKVSNLKQAIFLLCRAWCLLACVQASNNSFVWFGNSCKQVADRTS